MPASEFKGNVILLGCGGVNQSLLTIFDKMMPEINFDRVTIFDKEDRRQKPTVQYALANGATFVQNELTPSNVPEILDELAEEGDLIIDLTSMVGCPDIIEYCMDNDIRYISSDMGFWDEPEEEYNWVEDFLEDVNDSALIADLESECTYPYQVELRDDFPASRPSEKVPTCIVDHGMNPGLVSHFTKAALEKITDSVLEAARIADVYSKDLKKLRLAREKSNFAKMAYILGVKVIHISEEDSQEPKPEFDIKENEFLSTWSPDAFIAEGMEPIQIGWGSHEMEVPENARKMSMGEQHQLIIPREGIKNKVKSFVPGAGEIEGHTCVHSENATICSLLTVKDGRNVVYRPTVQYVYQPPRVAEESWKTYLENPSKVTSLRVLDGSHIASGADAVGVLLMLENNPVEFLVHGKTTEHYSYWAGTILDIETTRRVCGEHAAPTEIQVAASVLSVALWAMDHPYQGLTWPEAVSHDFILKHASPFLGKVVFEEVKWGGEPKGLQYKDFVVGEAGVKSPPPPVVTETSALELQFASSLQMNNAVMVQ